MGISVPPAFIAYDSKNNQCGALIEWFLKPQGLIGDEFAIPGGDYCQQYMPGVGRKKGEQHNFDAVSEIFKGLSKEHKELGDWKNYWANAFVFDALIGNTDRHQDNWSVIFPTGKDARISPVFDNGTSMGHEISAKNFHLFEDRKYIERYILKGTHHIKWSLLDHANGHCELLKKLANKYPETRLIMVNCLKKVDGSVFKNILDHLVASDIPVRLTPERAAFMLKLLQFRHQYLLNELEK